METAPGERPKMVQQIKRWSLALTLLGAAFVAAQPQSQPHLSNAGYVEPGVCAGCHADIAEKYARTGMARTFGRVRTEGPFPELKKETVFHHVASDEFFTVYARGGKPYLKRHQIGFDGTVTNVLEAPIDYWIGSGNHARSFIARTKSGELVELPLTWYAEKGGAWAMSPAYDRPNHAGFSRKITARCLFCHNAYPTFESSMAASVAWEGETRLPERLPEGIDCQRCHGPGQAHVNAAMQGLSVDRVRSGIINPARLPPDRQMEVCMQCHLETTSLSLPATLVRSGRGVFSYRPGEPLENYTLHFDRAPGSGLEKRFEFGGAAYRLRQSRCFQQSGGRLTCTTCHDPHEPSNTPAAIKRTTEACQTCHSAASAPHTLARGAKAPPPRATACSTENCASCHLPKRRPDDAVRVTVTDHYISVPQAVARDNDSSSSLVERHDANTPPYRGEVVLYYPPTLAKTPENELSLAVAQIKHQANLEKGLARLEAAIARYAPTRAEFYFDLAEGYRHAGKLDKALAYYEQACARQPTDWRHFYRLGTTLSALGRLDRAVQALARARSMASQEPAVLEAIANVLSRQGKLPEAVSTLEAAIVLDPESASAFGNLGARRLQLGDASRAETAWREAVRLRPESAANRLNLANLLASRGSWAEAEHHLKAAIRTEPTFVDAYVAYASTLLAQQDFNGARQQLEAALRFAPDHFEAHLKLGRILFARGEMTLALPHLRKAAQSPDAGVRTAANAVLHQK